MRPSPHCVTVRAEQMASGTAPHRQFGAPPAAERETVLMGEFVLSSRSIGVLAEAIEAGNSATTMATLFLKADVDRWEPEVAANELARAVKLLQSGPSVTMAADPPGVFRSRRIE